MHEVLKIETKPACVNGPTKSVLHAAVCRCPDFPCHAKDNLQIWDRPDYAWRVLAKHVPLTITVS